MKPATCTYRRRPPVLSGDPTAYRTLAVPVFQVKVHTRTVVTGPTEIAVLFDGPSYYTVITELFPSRAYCSLDGQTTKDLLTH